MSSTTQQQPDVHEWGNDIRPSSDKSPLVGSINRIVATGWSATAENHIAWASTTEVSKPFAGENHGQLTTAAVPLDIGEKNVDDSLSLSTRKKHFSNSRTDNDTQGITSSLAQEEHAFAMNLSVQLFPSFKRAEDKTLVWREQAWKFVEKVFALHRELCLQPVLGNALGNSQTCFCQPVAVDDMVEMAERLFEAQAVFDIERKPTHVDIGYHYTRSANLRKIRTHGLLTKAERFQKSVEPVHYNGSAFGDGVYTGSNPYSHRSYGDVGLLVARLKGKVNTRDRHWRASGGRFEQESREEDFDTGTKNAGKDDEMIILRSSVQCVPLSRFPKKSLFPIAATGAWDSNGTAIAHEQLYCFHKRLQLVVDDFFNAGQSPTNVQVVGPPTTTRPCCAQTVVMRASVAAVMLSSSAAVPQPAASGRRRQPLSRIQRATFVEPKRHILTCTPTSSQTHRYIAPKSFPDGKTRSALSPSGTLRLLRYKQEVHDCGGCGFILLAYHIPSGIQQWDHPHPGRLFLSRQFCAFLPDNSAGRNLAKRLVGAFLSGRTFEIEGLWVVWSSIPHKRSLHSLRQDSMYILECNHALDVLGVNHQIDTNGIQT